MEYYRNNEYNGVSAARSGKRNDVRFHSFMDPDVFRSMTLNNEL